MGGPNDDHLKYTQGKMWFPRTKILTGTPELAVTDADAVAEKCRFVKETQVFAISGAVLASNRSDGTFFSIDEGNSFLFPIDGNHNVWIKGGTALVIAIGFDNQ